MLSNDSFAIFVVCGPFYHTNDHNSIILLLSFLRRLVQGSTNPNTRLNFNKADWNSILSTIHDIDWPHLFKNISMENLWDCFHYTLLVLVTLS